MNARQVIIATALLVCFVGSASAQYFGQRDQSLGRQAAQRVLDGVSYGAVRTFDFTLREMGQDSALARSLIQQEYFRQQMERQTVLGYALNEQSQDNAEERAYRERNGLPPRNIARQGPQVGQSAPASVCNGRGGRYITSPNVPGALEIACN